MVHVHEFVTKLLGQPERRCRRQQRENCQHLREPDDDIFFSIP